MTKRNKIDYLLQLIDEHIDGILTEEGSGLEHLSPSEVISLAFELATTEQFNLTQVKYRSPIALVNKQEAFIELADGTYQPLFEVHNDEDSL